MIKKNQIWLLILGIIFQSFVITSKSEAILNGRNATGSPYVVKISSSIGTCSAGLVKPQILVTAAHCVLENGNLVSYESIKIWSPGVDTAGRQISSKVIGIIYPDNYESSDDFTDPNDIAFIVTDSVIGSPQIEILADFDQYMEILESGAEIRIYGYGRTGEFTSSSNIPYSFSTSAAYKRIIWRYIGFERTFWLFSNSTDGAICPGDSGGPGVAIMNGKTYLMSVTSGSSRSCSSSYGDWTGLGTIPGEYNELYLKAQSLVPLSASAPQTIQPQYPSNPSQVNPVGKNPSVPNNSVVKMEQVLKIDKVEDVILGNQGVIHATSNSDLVIRYISKTPSICQLASLDDYAYFDTLKVGVCKVGIYQFGDDNYKSAKPVNISFNVKTKTLTKQTTPKTSNSKKSAQVVPRPTSTPSPKPTPTLANSNKFGGKK